MGTHIGEGGVKPFIKALHRFENLWEQKVQEGPELWKAVLQRGSSQEHPVPRGVVLGKGLGQLAVGIFHAMPWKHTKKKISVKDGGREKRKLRGGITFVNDHVGVLVLGQGGLVFHDKVIGGQDNIELGGLHLLLELLSKIGISQIHNLGNLKCPQDKKSF